MLLDLASILLTFSISEGQVIVLGERSRELPDPAVFPAEFPDPKVGFFSSLAAGWRLCLESCAPWQHPLHRPNLPASGQGACPRALYEQSWIVAANIKDSSSSASQRLNMYRGI